MFIIFVAHADINPLNNWIPSQFGFSSGAEIFVFCSGFASALAFGRTYATQGFILGLARNSYRIWQIYWAHLCCAVLVIAMSAAAQLLHRSLLLDLLVPIGADPLTALLSLATLHWLPGFLDILPMYIVLLAMIPVAIVTHKLHPMIPILLSVGLYSLVWTRGINLTGDPWTSDGWFFNPFAWQLQFFLGFSIASRWISAPSLGHRPLVALCAVFVLVSIPLASWQVRGFFPALEWIHGSVLGAVDKTNLHPLRVVHFFALAYLALSVIDIYKLALTGPAAQVVARVGQQSLAVFLASIFTARCASIVFQLLGTGAGVSALVNSVGFVVILATAQIAHVFKSVSWRSPRAAGNGRHRDENSVSVEPLAIRPQPDRRTECSVSESGCLTCLLLRNAN